MKIGFYLQNSGIKDIDCSLPMKGNPGIGGTEYLFTAIPYALSHKAECAEHGHQIYLFAQSLDHLPEGINLIQADDDTLAQKAAEHGMDLMIIRCSDDNLKIVRALSGNIKAALWAHNFIPRKQLAVLAREKKVNAIICVGSEQLHFYRDHRAYDKSVVIYNGYPVKTFIKEHRQEVMPFGKRENEVTFLGNLVDYKGFHLLAKAWKDVLKEVPDAKLNVIGGATLYDRNQKLGKWKLAEEGYENSFIPYLLDENGRIMDSVVFHGVLGDEKKEILNRTKVGVPNPGGVSETFCIAALEMQLWGSRIATINFGGYKDSVYDKVSLYDNPEQLAKYIVAQLGRDDNDYENFLKFAGKFDFDVVTNDWLLLFDTLSEEKGMVKNILKPQLRHEHKWKEINRRIKNALPFGRYMPTFMLYNSILWRLGLRRNS